MQSQITLTSGLEDNDSDGAGSFDAVFIDNVNRVPKAKPVVKQEFFVICARWW
jgi:hypothetical protein